MYSRDAPELAIKRLLLENVLLFASRRVPQSDSIDLSNAEVIFHLLESDITC